MSISEIHQLYLTCTGGIATDTRKIKSNSLFVALKGENFNANTFAKNALELGANYVIIDEKEYFVDQRTIFVEDALTTLQELAKYHRNYLKIPIIALTGSNGKTTTKELIYQVLSKKYKAQATVGNLNNHIGVPLTLLSFTKETEIGIVEMGANHQKEIAFLCSIAQPDYGYITNFGKAHLEGFGGVEGVIKGKSEMYDYLLENNKQVIVNADDTIQVEKTKASNTYSFTLQNNQANIIFTNSIALPFVSLTVENIVIHSQLIGLYNATNVAAAITIGHLFNVSFEQCKEAIESYIPENNRSQIIRKQNREIILDAYNANPSSMALAIDNFMQLHATKRMLVLGDMFELGNESLQEHKAILDKLTQYTSLDFLVYFVGKDFYTHKISDSRMVFCHDFEDFKQQFKNDDSFQLVLIKGSRGMALERILDLL